MSLGILALFPDIASRLGACLHDDCKASMAREHGGHSFANGFPSHRCLGYAEKEANVSDVLHLLNQIN